MTLGTLLPAFLSSKVPAQRNISGISTNAQTTKPGEIFFALKGAKHDAHSFIPDVLKKQPAAIVVEDNSCFERFSDTVRVDSTRKALAIACSHWFHNPSHSFKLVGVTGTNGKTTTTYLLKQVWDLLGKKNGLIGTVGNYLGEKMESSVLTTPDPYSLQEFFHQMVQQKIHVGSMEVSSIALDQFRVDGTRFEVGVFTNLTQDHLDYHHTFEKYANAKQRFFIEFNIPNVVVNGDDSYGMAIWKACSGKKWRFGSSSEFEFHFKSFDLSKAGTRASVSTPQGIFELKTPLIGRHNLSNCLCVLAVMNALGEKVEEVVKALSLCLGAPGRLERAAANVFVDYAHTDDALKNVLDTLRAINHQSENSGRLITVFGCGGDRDRTKRPKMGAVASTLSDIVIATSDNPRTEDPEKILDEIEKGIDTTKVEYRREVNRRKAIELALSLAKPEDVVLIAGKGHETYQIIGTEKLEFDDRAVVRSFTYRETCPA